MQAIVLEYECKGRLKFYLMSASGIICFWLPSFKLHLRHSSLLIKDFSELINDDLSTSRF